MPEEIYQINIDRTDRSYPTKTNRKAKKLHINEVNLLLKLEKFSVENGGLVDVTELSEVDNEILRRWNNDNFVRTGSLKTSPGPNIALWCWLSEDAWLISHYLRREKFVRERSRSIPDHLRSPKVSC